MANLVKISKVQFNTPMSFEALRHDPPEYPHEPYIYCLDVDSLGYITAHIGLIALIYHCYHFQCIN